MRWAASDIRICSSLSVPLFFFGLALLLFVSSISSGVSSFVSRQPLPKIMPRFILGHLSGFSGHMSFARSHTSFTGVALHVVSMCSIDSIVLQILHFPLSL